MTMAPQVLRRAKKRVRLVRDMIVVARSGIFDGAWYLQQNPDVARAGVSPLVHYLRHGGTEGRDPHPLFDSSWYLEQYPDVARAGINPLAHYLLCGAREGRSPHPRFDSALYVRDHPESARSGGNPLAHFIRSGVAHNGYGEYDNLRVEDLLRNHFRGLRPLRVFFVPGLGRRITMVTDSINEGSLFGGVATAIILSTLLAKKLGARLRIVTRHAKADERNFQRIVEPNRIDWRNNVEFVYADVGDESAEIDVETNDLFLTTSWWTTWSVKQAIAEEKIVYLLQEDERTFYPFSDEHLLCAETLGSSDIRFVINSKLMYDHLVAQGFDNIRRNGLWFEPSFPKTHYYQERHRDNNRKNFLFYARPNNLRNLYYRGLEVISQAVKRGILDPKDWNIVFVGKDLTGVVLPRDCRPKIMQNLQWSDYAALLRQVDVGLSLMYTPHPSYPPLDLAACGAVVVTNRFGPKQSLEQYSKNILCRGIEVESLVEGIAEAVELARDLRTRNENYCNNALLDNWTVSFDSVLRNIV